MANILIIYSTTDGHTKKICERLQDVLEQQAHEVTLVSMSDNPQLDLSLFDKIVIGASKPGGSCLCSWDNIVWIGTHSWKMPFNPLVPGDKGYSSSGPRK